MSPFVLKRGNGNRFKCALIGAVGLGLAIQGMRISGGGYALDSLALRHPEANDATFPATSPCKCL